MLSPFSKSGTEALQKSLPCSALSKAVSSSAARPRPKTARPPARKKKAKACVFQGSKFMELMQRLMTLRFRLTVRLARDVRFRVQGSGLVSWSRVYVAFSVWGFAFYTSSGAVCLYSPLGPMNAWTNAINQKTARFPTVPQILRIPSTRKPQPP